MSKAPVKPAEAAKPEKAKPDAALLDRESEDGEATDIAVVPARTGIKRYLPSSVIGWAAMAAIVTITVGGAATAKMFLGSDSKSHAAPSIAGTARAIDGGTLVVAGQTVRLQGIEAPPASLVCRDGVWEYKCGDDARKALEQVVAGHTLDCDPVGPIGSVTVAQCHSEQGIDVAAAVVERGGAVADLRRSSRYLPQHSKARDEGQGLWRNNFAFPEQWRLAARGEIR